LIQRQALRLFREQGYEATTVEQIAEAAEISPSTFFRYFPTKEAVILYDRLDELVISAFEAQPAELSPIQAFRAALRQVLRGQLEADLSEQAERIHLMMHVPELRMRMLDQLVEVMPVLQELLARRLQRPANDVAVSTWAGAILGVGLAALLASRSDLGAIWENMDARLAYLESGLPL
jgi:AcrR family transcriptional regulator